MDQVAPVAPAEADALTDPRDRFPEVFKHADNIRAESGGLTTCDVVQHSDVPALQAAARAGDGFAQHLLLATDAVAAKEAASSPGNPLLCLGCDRPARDRPYSVVVVSAGAGSALYLSGPVCIECADTRDAVRQVALPVFRQLWPGFRLLPPIHPEYGHA